jgi:2-dehydropantoate 2-reductase
MRIAVMAAGAVGGYFGARLANAGHDVVFFARGAHLDALRARGLRVESPLGDLHLQKVHATDRADNVGPVDVVLFAVKLWDTESAAAACRPLVGSQTRVITLQNGVDSVERLTPIVGDAATAGIAYIASVIAAPGVIRHSSSFAQIRCGRLDGGADAALDRFAAEATAARVDVVVSPTIGRELWEKFVFLVGLSSITAATRSPIGPILADAETRDVFHKVMREVLAVAQARGVPLPPDFADQRLKFSETLPAGTKASMLHDLEAGRPLELDWLAGKVVALGRERRVQTPLTCILYALLKLHRDGTKETAQDNRHRENAASTPQADRQRQGAPAP